MRVLFLILLLVGCCTVNIMYQHFSVKPVQRITYFNSIVKKSTSMYVQDFMRVFYSKGCKNNFDVKIKFAYFKSNKKIGICKKDFVVNLKNKQQWVDGIIYLNYAIWQELSSNDRRTVMYHELGHCVLRSSHSYDNKLEYPELNYIDWDDPESNKILENFIDRYCII